MCVGIEELHQRGSKRLRSDLVRLTFQRAVLVAQETAVLQTSPGHVTRCVPSPYVDEFLSQQVELQESGVDSQEIWQRLDALNAIYGDRGKPR